MLRESYYRSKFWERAELIEVSMEGLGLGLEAGTKTYLFPLSSLFISLLSTLYKAAQPGGYGSRQRSHNGVTQTMKIDCTQRGFAQGRTLLAPDLGPPQPTSACPRPGKKQTLNNTLAAKQPSNKNNSEQPLLSSWTPGRSVLSWFPRVNRTAAPTGDVQCPATK